MQNRRTSEPQINQHDNNKNSANEKKKIVHGLLKPQKFLIKIVYEEVRLGNY
jgi:hypothetical protein